MTRLDGKHYVLDGIDGRDKRVTVKANDNVVNIYYALDEKGAGPDPNKPDQIPDKYQITFTYTASANGKDVYKRQGERCPQQREGRFTILIVILP